ncbi:hypothetical protein [Leptospira jelokensis]|nr:hypothetical protein [Leptospira jelokensis]
MIQLSSTSLNQIGVKVGMKLEIITFGNRMELIPIEPIKCFTIIISL